MDIVPLFKALADQKRIKIIGLITDRGLSVEEIAAAVDLTPPTVSHHLSLLRNVGLVHATNEQYYTIYKFDSAPLLEALRSITDQSAPQDLSDDLAKYDRKVLEDYIVDGKFKSIPAQRKKRDVLLRYLVEQFDRGSRYTEKEISIRIADFHDDFATLRRELIMAKLMERENGVYWRI